MLSMYKHLPHRKEMIEVTLTQLVTSSNSELMARLGKVYRSHYRCRCKGMSWEISLPVLQLAAVCLGPRVLTGICRALAMNFKFFSSGAPDLLMMRLQSTTSPSTSLPLSHMLGEDWQEGKVKGATLPHEDEDLTQPVTKKRRKGSSPSPDKKSMMINDDDVESEMAVVPKESAYLCPYAEDLNLPDSYACESLLVEVKGPSDHLSRQQTSWLKLLAGLGAKALVCRVREEKLDLSY